jgi:hypothetical protein
MAVRRKSAARRKKSNVRGKVLKVRRRRDAMLRASLKLITSLRQQTEKELWWRWQEEDEGMKDYVESRWRARESEEADEKDWEVECGGDAVVERSGRRATVDCDDNIPARVDR